MPKIYGRKFGSMIFNAILLAVLFTLFFIVGCFALVMVLMLGLWALDNLINKVRGL